MTAVVDIDKIVLCCQITFGILLAKDLRCCCCPSLICIAMMVLVILQHDGSVATETFIIAHIALLLSHAVLMPIPIELACQSLLCFLCITKCDAECPDFGEVRFPPRRNIVRDV